MRLLLVSLISLVATTNLFALALCDVSYQLLDAVKVQKPKISRNLAILPENSPSALETLRSDVEALVSNQNVDAVVEKYLGKDFPKDQVIPPTISQLKAAIEMQVEILPRLRARENIDEGIVPIPEADLERYRKTAADPSIAPRFREALTAYVETVERLGGNGPRDYLNTFDQLISNLRATTH